MTRRLLRPNTAVAKALAVLLLSSFAPLLTHAQAKNTLAPPTPSPDGSPLTEQTFRLNASAPPSESRDISIVLRNLLDPHSNVSLLEGQNAIAVNATPDQLRLAQKIFDDVETPTAANALQPASRVFPTQTQTTVHTSPNQAAEQTFYLPSTIGGSDASKLGATLRQTASPSTKIYWLPTHHALVVNSTPDQLQLVGKTISQQVPSWSADNPNATSPIYTEQPTETYTDTLNEQTFYLPQGTDRRAGVEVLVALRNTMSPVSKVYLVSDKNALVISATAAELQLAQKVLTDLNPPRPAS